MTAEWFLKPKLNPVWDNSKSGPKRRMRHCARAVMW